MTDYLQLARERAAGAPPSDAANPYMGIALENQRRQESQVRAVVERALKEDPELAAERQRLSQTSGLPLSVVERNLEEIRRKEAARALDIARMMRDSPVLARQLLDPSFTTVAQDDIGVLGQIERFARDLGGAAKAGVFRASRGAAGTFQAGLELVAPVLDPLESVTAIGGNPLRRLAEGFAMQGAAAGRTAEAARPRADGNIASGFFSGIESLTQNLLALPMAFLPGGQGAALTMMTAGAGGDAYQTAREKGLPMSQALPFATSQAAIEYATERLPLGALLKDVRAGAGFLQILGRQIALEVPGEQIATVLQDLNEWAVLNPNKPFSSYLEERPSAAAQTLVATIVGAGGNVAVVKGIEAAISRLTADGANMQRAGMAGQALQRALELAGQSALRERSPEQFRALMGQMSGDAKVYVDGEVLNQLPPEALAVLPASVRDKIAVAAATGDTVEINVADALTVAPGTPLAEALTQHARTSPDAPSAFEAQVAGEQAAQYLQQEAQRVIEQAQDQAAARAAQEAVKANIKAQLAVTGRFRDAVNEGYATWASAFYTAYGSRLGLTAEEFFQRYPLRVLGAAAGQQTGVLNAPAGQTLETTTPEFRSWFGNSQLVQNGRPQVLYHGTADDITQFDLDNPNRKDAGYLGTGVYLTDSPDMAELYAMQKRRKGGAAPNVMPLYARLENPYFATDADRARVRAGGRAAADAFTAELQAQGYDGVIYQAAPDGREIVIFNTSAVKSVFNRAPTDAEGLLEQRGVQVKGKTIPPSVDAVSNVESSFAFAGTQTFANNRDFKLAIQGRVLEVAKAAKVKLDEFTQGVEQYLVRIAVADGKTALRTNANAVGWYNEKVTKALRLVSLIHPEINTDPQAKFAFVWAMAVTSNGLKVDKNFELAEQVYRQFKAAGQMPTDVGIGTAAEAINRSLGLYNTLIAKHGFNVVERFMTTMQTAGDVEAFTGNKVSGENKTTMVYGAAALGPKIGNGFFMNLYGRFEQLTMDRWLMRTWGRWTATLVESNPAQVKAKRTQLKALVQSLTPADKKAFEAIIKRKMTVGDIDAVGEAIWKASQKPANRKAMAAIGLVDEAGQARLTEILGEPKKDQVRVSLGDELRKGGNALTKYLDGQKEAPAGPPERGNIRKVFRQALAELQREHPALTMSDFQALLWYPEKRLYDAAKTADEAVEAYQDDEAPDYANAAAKLARSQGISDADIDATVAAVDLELLAAISAAGVRPGERGLGAGAGAAEQQVLNQGRIDGRDQQAGDGAGRPAGGSLAPLEGAPNVAGATGPDPRLVAVAEQYARDNGIDLRRQGEYAKVDPERAARIAAAYDAMVHAPQDPAVREAYENLIRQTMAQYRALEAAGYRFYLVDETNDPYGGNPWNAMRDLRANQVMGVFATEAGFGSGATELNVEDNPLLADTGLRWPYGSLDGEPKRVLANDLFRAVHDAFGHGIEGAGFRAQGEENAWQAHVRLFTGSARGAITSETRGQNSWLNFGPYGESNRTAKVEDTVFSEQKTGLMPEWTWTEGLVEDMPDQALQQGPRGTFNPQTLELVLNPNADLSTWFHETGHFFLEVLADVASQPGAPQQIADDMSKVLAWFGVQDLATWNAMTLDQKRPYHERWAESIEQYVMEGKAPNVELQPVMRRFRAWLTNVYQSIKQFVAGRPGAEQQPLNDDIRRVMDRLIATDEQIAQANEVAGLMPDEQADGEAAERLQKRSIADLKWAVKARDKVIAKLKREAREIEKTIRAEVTAEIDQRPEVLAKAAIEKAEKEFEADPVSADMNIAAIADSFGYPSVEAMYRAIEAFGDKQAAIDGLTERRMLEENGDLIDERAIKEAANEAVHNEARARSLATELRTQQEMLGQRADTGQVNARGARLTVNVLVEAAKQFGANVIARTSLKDLRATAWKHTAAERRAGKRWQEATMAGDTAAAVKAKQDQMLNNAAAKAALDAAAEAKKILEFFARVTKGNDEKTVEKGRDPDIVNAARAVLAAYGVETPASKGAAAYLERVKQNDPDTWTAIEPMIAAATQNAQPLEALTFEELQGLEEAVRAMWFLAKRSRQMEVDGNLLDIDDAALELFARMEQIGIPDRVPGEGMAVTRAEERGLFLKQGIAFLRRVEQWAEGMDGKYGGPFLKYVFQPIKDAADRYRKDRIEYRKKFQALVEQIPPIAADAVIEAPELGYTFGTPGSTAGTAMNEVLHAIAHTGNDSNKRKLLLGRGWATELPDGTLDTTQWDAFIRRLVAEGKLVQGHYDFVQGVWDLLEDTKPLAQKAHRDAFGRYFSEVTANEFIDPFNVMRRGGYVPAQVDGRLVKDNALRKLAEEENNSMAFAFPQPAKGFTMARTEYNRPLMLDLRSLSQHLDKVLLFSHMTNPARDVRKLLTRKTVSQPLDRMQPAALESMLQPWLQRSAQQIVETPIVGSGKWARLPGIIRARAGMALMFANVSNAVQQITGLAGAAVLVKPSFLMRSLAQYVANPRQFSQGVWGASPYMDDRAKNEVSVLNEQMEAILINPSTYEKVKDWSSRHAYFLQTALDNVLSPIVWTGAYNQALADGMSDTDAVKFADRTVRQTQGSTLPEDVSRIETGPAYARAFTQFLGYFNMMANTNGTALKQIAGEVGLKRGAGKALYVVMMGFMAPIWIAEAIALAFRGGPEDEDDDGYLDDWLAEVFGMGTLKGLLAQIPIAGQFGVAAVQRFNDNPLDDRVSLSPAVSLLESSVGAPQSVYKAIVEDGSAQKAIRDVATLVSVATGVPVYGLARPIGYAAGVAQGRIEPEGPADLARGLITGTASPESRVP